MDRIHSASRFIRIYGVQQLFPGYFALVMATGIISSAAFSLNYEWIAEGMFRFNLGAFVVLWLLLLMRAFCYRRELLADLRDHRRSPGFFTLVAATNVLGSQFIVQKGDYGSGGILWMIGLVLWFLTIYAFFFNITIKANKPTISKGLNGTWLISVVATQSVVTLGVLWSETFSGPAQEVFLFSMSVFFLIGCMLYIMVITMIFYRFSFFTLKPEDLDGPYWINMGSVAITTLAGSSLILHLDPASSLWGLKNFLAGFTLFFWSIGTWWIPLLLLLGFWRHVFCRVPLPWRAKGYAPSYWGLVFPLGMYTVCTLRLSEALELPFLEVISQWTIFVAFAAWLVTFAGLAQVLILNLLFAKGNERSL